jgi:hypothetical protein
MGCTVEYRIEKQPNTSVTLTMHCGTRISSYQGIYYDAISPFFMHMFTFVNLGRTNNSTLCVINNYHIKVNLCLDGSK